ncbi:protein kinase family protein [Nocardia sp. NPDC051570]|uniref:protein kinase family protein n=1 Tax=Nocardia sp. NPDC051570 TaxID=3364324 RepID=UPI0037B683A7
MHDPDPLHAARVARYTAAHDRLSAMSDRELAGIVGAGVPHGSGIGGRSAAVDIGGTRVFVKRVPLTEWELRPGYARSTANVFGLPMCYQYGLGSAGFSAWRELTAHLITTDWVLGGDYPGSPIMYHWRVLPDTAPEGFADEFGGLEGAVSHWDSSPAVRRRLEAIGRSRASLVLFLEHLPHTLADWLDIHRGDPGVYPWAAQALARGTAFLSSRGFVHFDAHFANVLTDGRLIYFADLGLALSRRFDLSAQESEFLADHRVYDYCYTATHLLGHYLFARVRDQAEYEVFLRDWIAGRRPGDIPPELAALIDQHVRPAVLLNDFHRSLLTESKQTPFPWRDIEQELAPVSARTLSGAGVERVRPSDSSRSHRYV